MRPDFSKIDYIPPSKGERSFEQWEKEAAITKEWKTQIGRAHV